MQDKLSMKEYEHSFKEYTQRDNCASDLNRGRVFDTFIHCTAPRAYNLQL